MMFLDRNNSTIFIPNYIISIQRFKYLIRKQYVSKYILKTTIYIYLYIHIKNIYLIQTSDFILMSKSLSSYMNTV